MPSPHGSCPKPAPKFWVVHTAAQVGGRDSPTRSSGTSSGWEEDDSGADELEPGDSDSTDYLNSEGEDEEDMWSSSGDSEDDEDADEEEEETEG